MEEVTVSQEKEIFGEYLFQRIKKTEPELAAKIVGTLLDKVLKIGLIELLKHKKLLEDKVKEMVVAMRQQSQGEEIDFRQMREANGEEAAQMRNETHGTGRTDH